MQIASSLARESNKVLVFIHILFLEDTSDLCFLCCGLEFGFKLQFLFNKRTVS